MNTLVVAKPTSVLPVAGFKMEQLSLVLATVE